MTEELQPLPAESPAPAEPAEATSTPVAPKPARDAAGRFAPAGFVELSPEAQARFNRVYGELKRHKAVEEQLVRDNTLLLERLAAIEGTVAKTAEATNAAALRQAKAEALALQDYSRVVEIDEALLDLRLGTSKPANGKIESASAVESVEEPLDPRTISVLQSWGQARDGSGNLLRPWVMPDHPEHERAKAAYSFVIAGPDLGNVEAILAHVDELMGSSPPPKLAPPPPPSKAKPVAFLATDVPPPNPRREPELTAEQIYIAKQLYRNDTDVLNASKNGKDPAVVAASKYKAALGRYATAKH